MAWVFSHYFLIFGLRNGKFGHKKRTHRHLMLRALAACPSLLVRGASHGKCSAFYPFHFIKRLGLRGIRQKNHQKKQRKHRQNCPFQNTLQKNARTNTIGNYKPSASFCKRFTLEAAYLLFFPWKMYNYVLRGTHGRF
jgi:hypothetical protein